MTERQFHRVAVWDPGALDDIDAQRLARFLADWPPPWTWLIVRDRTGVVSPERLRRLLRDAPLDRIWINRDPELAAALGAAGITLGAFDTHIAEAAMAHGLPWICSVHALEDLRSAPARHATALLFGHVRDTPSKPGLPGRGFDALERICAATTLPVIAIGGLTLDDAPMVEARGASGLAAIRASFG